MNKFYNALWGIKPYLKDLIIKAGDIIQFVTPIVFLVYVALWGTKIQAKVFVVCYAITVAIQVTIKALFNNPRPRQVEGTENPDLNLDWSPNEGESFCSGHTMSAMVGGIFWLQIHWAIGIIGILLGLFTGFSRIVAKAHWLRDVLTSIAISTISYIIALYFI